MKPKPPIIVYALGLLAVVGLIALGIAAFTAFSKVAEPPQALAAAVLIEAALVIEGITLIRRNWWAAAGVLVSLVVSGTYNYIQAEQAGRLVGITNGWQLLTLAIGPLSALLFLALTIGFELREHEKRVSTWEAEQAALREKREQARRAEQERLHAEQLEREEAQRKAAQDLELARIEAEKAAKLAEIRAQARTQARQVADDERKLTGNFPADWRKLPDEDKAIILTLTSSEIAQRYGVSDRTARNWRIAAANGNGKH